MKQHSSNHSSNSWLMLVACLACCWGVSRIPEEFQRQVRATLLDGCRPFQEARSAAADVWESRWPAREDRLAEFTTRYQKERAAWEAELRRRELAIAQLNDRRQIHQEPEASPFPVVPSDSLIEYELVAAAVIGPGQLDFLQRGILIRSDELNDLERDSLVIQAANDSAATGLAEIILDQGETTGFEPEQPVYAGRCVVGTLSDVGRWISRVRLVTDPEYRGRARIVRQVEGGFVFGPEGILEGTGEPLCRVRYLSHTESVRVGDRVYTSGNVPMYYGQVVRAELDDHAPEWNVWIQPAIELKQIHSVQVLRQKVNSLRRLAN